ncbi:MAG: hypothetical protein AB8B91_00755 [Rubripirellula sp.]
MQWLATIAAKKAPRTFDGDKDWGKTKQVWSGVKIRREGLQLKTHRRFRELEQGRWVKYEIELPVSVADSLTISEVVPVTNPTGQKRWNVSATLATPLQFTARVQRWNLGVKIFSVTITGHMNVRLSTKTSIGFVTDYSEIPPAFVIDPVVHEAELVMEHFEVDRVSRIGGDVAEQWGKMIEETLVDRFVKKENERLVSKLNRSIDKERDDLRLSTADWLSKWTTD